MKLREGAIYSYFLKGSEFETEADTEEYLRDAGIDGEKFIAEMKEVIRLKIQDQLYKSGEDFRNKYLIAIKEETQEINEYPEDLQFAFRKKENLDESEIEELKNNRKKMDILKKLSKD